MDLNQLKSTWQQSGGDPKSAEVIRLMAQLNHHPQLKQVRVKLIIEVVLLAAFLLVYHNIFDGGEKPFWINAVLIGSALLFIASDVVTFILLLHPIRGDNLKESLGRFKGRLKRMAVFSIVTSLVFGSALILFFTHGLEWNSLRYGMLAGMIATMLILIFYHFRSWKWRIGQITNLGKWLREDHM